MRKVQLYVNDKRVDLYNDEKIQITSSIQTIADISKTMSDFSQSFTVPASDNNNDIFSFFYNNDVDGTYNAKNRAEARIEINHLPFKRGKVQLEGAEIKNNQAESYKLTFVGDVVTLKDLFGDKKLSDINYDALALEYNAANVSTSITSNSDLDVRFPLISSDRVWSHGTGANTDISNSSYPIVWTELFPAVKDKAIIDRIEAQFGITFNGNFFDSNYFKKSFTYFKNAVTPDISGEPESITFNDTASGSTLTNNQYTVKFTEPTSNGAFHQMLLTDITTSVNTTIIIDTYRNGELLTSQPVTYSGVAQTIYIAPNILNDTSLNDVYTLKARAQGTACTLNATVKHIYVYYTSTGTFTTNATTFTESIDALALTNNISFNNLAPDMKITDWFTGLLKMFNLTLYPLENELNYQVERLEDFYSFGGQVDITEYTDIKSIKVDRLKLYKTVSYEYAKSKAFLNETFFAAYNRHYGNLKEQFDYDGKDFKIKLPFENMYFNKFTGTNLQVSYALDSESGGKSYVPKPVKLFLDELKTTNVSFYFSDGSTASQITQYMPFGQDQFYNMQNHSQNFGFEVSTLKDEAIQNSLYMQHYCTYMMNLFNSKARKVTLKCILPLNILTILSLDDTIIVRDKKYTIDTMKTSLTTGEVEFTLISNFVQEKGVIATPTAPVPSESGTLNLPIKMLKPPNATKQFDGGGGYVTFAATRETQFITLTLPVTHTTERTLDITVPRNTTGSDRGQTIPVTYYDAAGNSIATTNIFIKQEG
jgi:hypothetical protein